MSAVATHHIRFRQAAWTYLGYGIVYWVGGLVLMIAGLGPPGTGRGGVVWLLAGALITVGVPWLLVRERPWFDRWVLSRRDFARLLSLWLVYRAYAVGRIASGPRTAAVPVLGVEVPLPVGAWAFVVITLVTALALARAGWSRP